jgi:hypothetical protein
VFGSIDTEGSTIRPTALPTIDAAVVGKMIRVRLKKVVTRAISDVLDENATIKAQRPLRDLAGTVVSLLFDVSDAEARSQALSSAVTRDGLAYGFALLGKQQIIDTGECTAFADLANASYEGLATTRYIGPLGFVSATGSVPENCATFASTVASYADLFGLAGRTLPELMQMKGKVDAVIATCDPAKLQELPTNVLEALTGARHAGAPLEVLRTLRQAWSTSVLHLPDSVAKQPYLECGAALDAFGITYDQTLSPLLNDKGITAGLSLSRLDESLASIAKLGNRLLVWIQLARTLDAQVKTFEEATGARALPDALAKSVACTAAGNCTDAVKASIATLSATLASFVDQFDDGALASALARVVKSGEVTRIVTAIRAVRTKAETIHQYADQLQVAADGNVARALAVAVKCPNPCPIPEVIDLRSALEAAVSNLEPHLQDVMRWEAALAPLQSIVRALVTGRPLQRGDVVALAKAMREAVDGVDTKSASGDSAKRILIAVLDALPNAIRADEDAPMGLRLDAPGLASAAVEGYENGGGGSIYPIATVGAGYILSAKPMTSDLSMTSAAFEELGIGYRYPIAHGRFELGVHFVTSGLLYQLQEDSATKNQFFVGFGPSVNLYKLIIASANIGGLVSFDSGETSTAFTFSLQLPLFDYLEALSDGDISTEGK